MKALLLVTFCFFALNAMAQPVEGGALDQIPEGARMTLRSRVDIPDSYAALFQDGRQLSRGQVRLGKPLCGISLSVRDQEEPAPATTLAVGTEFYATSAGKVGAEFYLARFTTGEGVRLDVICTERVTGFTPEGYILGEDLPGRDLEVGEMARIVNGVFRRPQP